MKPLNFTLIVFLFFTCTSCSQPQTSSTKNITNNPGVQCTDAKCFGTYTGPEFLDRSDVAHQFSNTMSEAVGEKLKELYDKKTYSLVDFENIEMSTEGMGSGTVSYSLVIPFKRVKTTCQAYTSFDHVGGWNHKPGLERRKKELASVLLAGEDFYISKLKTTKEGLQEYWIQWRNKIKQSDCTRDKNNLRTKE